MSLLTTLENFAAAVVGRNSEEAIAKAIQEFLVELHLINPATAPAEVLATVAPAATPAVELTPAPVVEAAPAAPTEGV